MIIEQERASHSPVIISQDQLKKIPLTSRQYPGGEMSYYFGKADYSEKSPKPQPSQDYLCVLQSLTQSEIAFTLCDGVSSSWVGQVASEAVGSMITPWLLETDLALLSLPELKALVATKLSEIQPIANQIADEHSLSGFPEDDVMHDVEVKAKEKLGSQTTFFCGKIEANDKTSKEGYVTFIWMGNTQCAVLQNGKWVDIADGKWTDKNRWSTKQGMMNEISVARFDLSEISRIVVHTDGVKVIDQLVQGNEPTSDLEAIANGTPLGDDVTFLDIELQNTRANKVS